MSTSTVIGLGSSHGDDRLGWAVLEALEIKLGSQSNIGYIYCDRTVFDWLAYTHGVDQVFFIDAVMSDDKPGRVHQIDLHEIPADRYKGLSTHGFSLFDAIEMAKSLDSLPTISILYGIELEQCQPLEIMQESVVDAVPICVEALSKALI